MLTLWENKTQNGNFEMFFITNDFVPDKNFSNEHIVKV